MNRERISDPGAGRIGGSGDPPHRGVPGIEYRPIEREDLPAALGLCRAAGWNQVAADWEELIVLGGGRCSVATIGGRVVGTVTAVEYGGKFAWIGMVLVDPIERGRGIGTSLVRYALASLCNVPARLDATPAGYPVYTALGFVEERRLERMKRRRAPATAAAAPFEALDDLPFLPPGPGVRPMAPGDLHAIARFDADAFGADRSALLQWAFANLPEFAWVAECPSGIDGFCLGRRGHHFPQIGPVVAASPEVAERLVAACVRLPVSDVTAIDAPSDCGRWMDRLSALGFVAERPFIRMFRGGHGHHGRPEMQLAILGPEWG